jgi:hypothetical protein
MAIASTTIRATAATLVVELADFIVSRFSRITRKLKKRWQWRVSRSKKRRLTIVSQFFLPDFAATGQLLADLTARLAARG